MEKIQSGETTDADLSNDELVPFGKGVITTSGEADTTLTFAGQVVNENLSFEVKGNGFTWTGNMTPTDLTLGDFAIPTDQNFLSGDSLTLAIYNESGSLEGEYSFVDEKNLAAYDLTTTGWYPLEKVQYNEATDDDCANKTVSIPAGKMVIITNGEADTTLTLPNPLN